MGRIVCGAKGTHKTHSWLRNVYCSLDLNHEGRHIAYWNHKISDVHIEQEQGEIGDDGAGVYFDWGEPGPFDSDTLETVNWFRRLQS